VILSLICMTDALCTGDASPTSPDGIDAVNKQIPPDATASGGIQGVEVAGIEPGWMFRDVLAHGADLRERSGRLRS